jgi:uncharacterized protein
VQFRAQSVLMASPQQVYGYHARPGAFARLTPPWERVRLLRALRTLANDELAVLEIPAGPLKLTWVANHHDIIADQQFVDSQLAGPFAHWTHCHRMEGLNEAGQTLLTDEIEYRLPMGTLGELGGGWFTRTKLERMFRYRHAVTANDLAAHQHANLPPLKVVISGVTGTIGKALAAFFSCGGHEVIGLVRTGSEPLDWLTTSVWDPQRGLMDGTVLEGADVVIHLAGAPLAGRRWNEAQKQRIRQSRLVSTKLLVETISTMAIKPSVFMSASGSGFYGDTGPAEFATESTAPGQGFLAHLAQEWEQASESLDGLGVRRVLLRLGMVLTPNNGALQALWWPTLLGGGWTLGQQEQWWSWVALDDVLSAVLHCLVTPSIIGPVNVVAPEPVQHHTFMKELAAVMHRPMVGHLPAAMVRTILGPMADAALFSNHGVLPDRLVQSGFTYHYPVLKEALSHQLGLNSFEETLQALASGG